MIKNSLGSSSPSPPPSPLLTSLPSYPPHLSPNTRLAVSSPSFLHLLILINHSQGLLYRSPYFSYPPRNLLCLDRRYTDGSWFSSVLYSSSFNSSGSFQSSFLPARFLPLLFNVLLLSLLSLLLLVFHSFFFPPSCCARLPFTWHVFFRILHYISIFLVDLIDASFSLILLLPCSPLSSLRSLLPLLISCYLFIPRLLLSLTLLSSIFPPSTSSFHAFFSSPHHRLLLHRLFELASESMMALSASDYRTYWC